MLEKDFVPPTPEVAKRETARRFILLEKFLPIIQPAITGLMVSGSVACGANYSVTEKSDIDMQLTVTDVSVKALAMINLFEPNALKKAILAYQSGIIKQFSLPFDMDGVTMECHFWDEKAYRDATTFVTATTVRLRSSVSPPSKDYGFSFDRSENLAEIPGEAVGAFAVSNFPSYRVVDGTMYFCRPITNVLGCMRVVFGEEWVNPLMDLTWKKAAQYLAESAKEDAIDLKQRNLLNTLPGKNKVSPECREQIMQRTNMELDSLGIKYFG